MQLGSVIDGPNRGAGVRALDRRRVAVERVEIDRAGLGIARSVEDRSTSLTVSSTNRCRRTALVGRFHRELVAAVREALLEEIDAIEAALDLGVGLRFLRLATNCPCRRHARCCDSRRPPAPMPSSSPPPSASSPAIALSTSLGWAAEGAPRGGVVTPTVPVGLSVIWKEAPDAAPAQANASSTPDIASA